MRLSLSYRRQGVDLTQRLDMLREAAVVFDDALCKAQETNTGTNEQDISILAAMIALYSSCIAAAAI